MKPYCIICNTIMATKAKIPIGLALDTKVVAELHLEVVQHVVPLAVEEVIDTDDAVHVVSQDPVMTTPFWVANE
jgi:hypothetical protein